jgi:lysyl-tRNA synthetase class 1
VGKQADIIKAELAFIDEWLTNWAPDEVKFALADKVNAKQFDAKQTAFLTALADKIEKAAKDADGEWFHKAIYDLQPKSGLKPQEVFKTLYQALIAKDAGPRAGWFLSILPREWLIGRLRLEA